MAILNSRYGQRWWFAAPGDFFVNEFGDVHLAGAIPSEGGAENWTTLGNLSDLVGSIAKMYGPIWPVDETPPKPEPEKSPIDKAIDDMMARRKAAREVNPAPAEKEIWDAHQKYQKEDRDGLDLERALSRAFVHHTPFTERLAGYRGIPLPALSKAETGAGGVR